MSSPKQPEELREIHTPESISRQLDKGTRPEYVSDAVLGGIDGGVTTFAVVSGAYGAGFSAKIALVLGLSNLLADGFSMAVSNFQARSSRLAHREALEAKERDHIAIVPEGEREEVRQIFERKGFTGSTLNEIVAVITSNRELWLQTMLVEEHGVQTHDENPYRAALSTFGAFVLVGILPLLPLMFAGREWTSAFVTSLLLAGFAFSSIGALRSAFLGRPIFRSSMATLFTGTSAALLAFGSGYLLSTWLG